MRTFLFIKSRLISSSNLDCQEVPRGSFRGLFKPNRLCLPHSLKSSMFGQSMHQKPLYICFFGWILQRHPGLSQGREKSSSECKGHHSSRQHPLGKKLPQPPAVIHAVSDLRTFPLERISLHCPASPVLLLKPTSSGRGKQLVTLLCVIIPQESEHLLLACLIYVEVTEAAKTLVEGCVCLCLPLFQDDTAEELFSMCQEGRNNSLVILENVYVILSLSVESVAVQSSAS